MTDSTDPLRIDELREQATAIIKMFGDNWRLDYDELLIEHGIAGEVTAVTEDSDEDSSTQMFTTGQTSMFGQPLAVAEFLAGSIKAVPALTAEVKQLRADLKRVTDRACRDSEDLAKVQAERDALKAAIERARQGIADGASRMSLAVLLDAALATPES